LEASALRSIHVIASVHRDPRNARVCSLEPLCRIDQSPEYRTRALLTFTFDAHGCLRTRCGLSLPSCAPVSRQVSSIAPERSCSGAWGARANHFLEVLEAAETPAAPVSSRILSRNPEPLRPSP
jgi:hypothetical protein